jgi:acetyl-CoA carboxylase biotin carboxyl carrier protein
MRGTTVSGHEPASVLAAVEAAAARLWADTTPGPSTVTVRCGDIEIRLGSAVTSAVAARTEAVPVTAALAVPVAEAPAAAAVAVRQVCAPLVGVFFRAPAPGEPPFVEVGDSIRVGQQVGIIEAMKMMVPVESDVAGRVTDFLAGNAEPVEFGRPLVAVAGD